MLQCLVHPDFNLTPDSISNCPELRNRFSEEVQFNQLGPTELAEILDHLVAELTSKPLTQKDVTLAIDESVKRSILSSNFDPQMGARPLERAVDKRLLEPVVDELACGGIVSGSAIRAVLRSNQITSCPRNGTFPLHRTRNFDCRGPLEAATMDRYFVGI